jgi:hypothetical protein
MKLAVAAMIALLGMSLTAQAQTKQPPQEVSITTQAATTDDGSKAILKSNGTWQYAKEDSVSTKTESTLSFDTGIVFRSGDIKPVARTDFYLLDKSLIQILLDGRFKNSSGEVIQKKEQIYYYFARSYSGYNIFDFYTDMFNQATALIKPHLVQSVKTDFAGKATFKSIPTGKYYLMGYCGMSKNYMVWNVEIDITPGNNSLTLDQNNLAYTLSP